MKIVYEYSHLGGSENLKVRYPHHEEEIYEVISLIQAKRTKISREKTMKGRRLYSPKNLNAQSHSLHKQISTAVSYGE